MWVLPEKQSTLATTCTVGAARESLNTFDLQLFQGGGCCFPFPLPVGALMQLPKTQPLTVLPWGGVSATLTTSLLCIQIRLFLILMAFWILPSGRLGLYKFSMNCGYFLNFVLSMVLSLPPHHCRVWGGADSPTPLDLQPPWKSCLPTVRCAFGDKPPRCHGAMCRRTFDWLLMFIQLLIKGKRKRTHQPWC